MKAYLIAVVILLLGIQTLAETCGGNCPSGICQSCPCGTIKKKVDIDEFCAKSDWDQTCCKCIISHGTGGNAHFTSIENSSYDVGLFKINVEEWHYCPDGKAPCDPDASLECALSLYQDFSWMMFSAAAACNCN